jgi:hypothetical protein
MFFCLIGFKVSLSYIGVNLLCRNVWVRHFFHYLKNLKIWLTLTFITVLQVVLLQPDVERESKSSCAADSESIFITGVILECDSNVAILKW